ncbi:MAG: DUF3102 domain-containing protein [Treponema sp.]|nr:DUF3102 domain-containing protein [Treponema sp.]
MAKFDGLLYIPASDQNFISGIQGLKDSDLNKMLGKLYELDESEVGHKGRIKAVEKEIKNRNGNSTEIIAVDKMRNEIETVERLYSDGMPYELERIENEIKFYMAQAAQSLFESGKRFLRIKAHEKHGDFMASLERIGIPQTTANYAMAVVIKFGSNSQALGNLGTTKIQMLTVLDEPDIKALVKDGVTGNLSLDEIDRMTTRELREAIRKEREKHQRDVDVREKAIKQKEVKISELDEQLRHQQPPTKEQIAQAALQKFNEPYTFVLARINGGIREAYNIVREAEKIPGVNALQLNEWLNQFDIEMQAFDNAKQGWLDEVDNASPIEVGKIRDVSDVG